MGRLITASSDRFCGMALCCFAAAKDYRSEEGVPDMLVTVLGYLYICGHKGAIINP